MVKMYSIELRNAEEEDIGLPQKNERKYLKLELTLKVTLNYLC